MLQQSESEEDYCAGPLKPNETMELVLNNSPLANRNDTIFFNLNPRQSEVETIIICRRKAEVVCLCMRFSFANGFLIKYHIALSLFRLVWLTA